MTSDDLGDGLLRAFLKKVQPQLTFDTVTFKEGVFRQLVLSEDDHRLIVVAPFTEKDQLKALGGVWHPVPPKGWSWYCTEKNLAMLLDRVPFVEIDDAIELAVTRDRELRGKQEMYKRLPADESQQVQLRVPGLCTTPERKLRTYQKLGILFGSHAQTGFLNGAEMGLGKSLMAIGTALWRKAYAQTKRCLIIAPASVKYNWRDELAMWTKEDFVIVDGAAKKRETQWAQDVFFYVVNPETLIRDMVTGYERPNDEWDLVIIDEIHMIKSWKSKRSQKIKELKLSPGGLRVGMSGTPIDGRLGDIHSIFEFLVPGLLPNHKTFNHLYTVQDPVHEGRVLRYKNIDDLNRVISPFFIRHLKKDVVKDLPPKVFKTVYVDLSADEMKQYKSLVSKAHEITADDMAATVILRARQFCDAPGLIDLEPRLGSKFYAALDIIEELVDNGKKALVFTMFEKMVQLMLQAFDEKNWTCLHITGAVSKEERQNVVKRFNEDPTVDLLVMDEAGSTGLNMQAASCVIHYDDNWSPAIMKQRTDRAHRLTTQHGVTVINMACRNTLEERHVRHMLNLKDTLSAEVMGDDLQSIAALGPQVSTKLARSWL